MGAAKGATVRPHAGDDGKRAACEVGSDFRRRAVGHVLVQGEAAATDGERREGRGEVVALVDVLRLEAEREDADEDA